MSESTFTVEAKRHTGSWEGYSSETKDADGNNVSQRRILSASVEVLKPSGSKPNYEMMMMVPLLQRDQVFGGREHAQANMRPSEDKKEIFSISKEDVDIALDADTIMAEIGELRHLIANGCAPIESTRDSDVIKSEVSEETKNMLTKEKKSVKKTQRKLTQVETIFEAFNTLFHSVLLVGEALCWVSIYNDSDKHTRDLVLFFLLIPTLFSVIGWICYNFKDRTLSCPSFCKIIGLLSISFPSPIFL